MDAPKDIPASPPAPDYTAVMQELAVQRSMLGDRAITLALQVAEKDARISELEKQIAELKREHPRAVK